MGVLKVWLIARYHNVQGWIQDFPKGGGGGGGGANGNVWLHGHSKGGGGGGAVPLNGAKFCGAKFLCSCVLDNKSIIHDSMWLFNHLLLVDANCADRCYVHVLSKVPNCGCGLEKSKCCKICGHLVATPPFPVPAKGQSSAEKQLPPLASM